MTDTQTAYAVFYLLSFRLAIILLGGLSIYLGYRLFTRALPRESGTHDGAELTGRFNNVELTLKNAAPGTFFAAFGAVITVVVLSGSPPEFRLSRAAEDGPDSQARSSAQALVRSGDETAPGSPDAVDGDITGRLRQELARSRDLALANPHRGDLQDLHAALLFVHGEFEKALALQREAVRLDALNDTYQARLRAYQAAGPR